MSNILDFKGYWSDFCVWVYQNLTETLKIMYSLITKFPKISDMGELYGIWEFITIISLVGMCITIVFLGVKMFINSASASNQIQVKTIFGRLIYATCFVAVSKPCIDLLIDFNNTLVDIFCNKFDLINVLNQDIYANSWVGLVAVGIAIFQLFLAGKIMIGYFLRIAEVALMYVTNPIMSTLWINPSWSGHFSSWVSRLVSLIFTQFAQVVILIIYSKVIFGFLISGNVFSLCLGAAFLILMQSMPSWIEKYIAPDNSAKIMVNTCKKINNSRKKLGKFYNKKKKVEGEE